ncbi:DUF6281 family protein [Streptomyces sp. NPDC005795]|uniref:DUF6281 family protein n=1 Tax=Streptomyces sp. NPDC005795 TaxID=3154677 RepID=UPI0033C15D69
MEAKTRMRRWKSTLGLAAVLVAGVTGCEGGFDAGGSSSKCAYLVKYEGRSYLDVSGLVAADAKFTVGKSLGTGLLPACDDTGGGDGTEEAEEVTVYEVDGIDPAVAVAAGATPADAVLVAVEGVDLPSLDVAP